MCLYLAATLASGLVAVFVKSSVSITVTRTTHWTAPPALGTRLFRSVVGKHRNITLNSANINFEFFFHNFSERKYNVEFSEDQSD